MTKREFDKLTKRNSRGLASDERAAYRISRHLPYAGGAVYGSVGNGRDLLAERAWERRRAPKGEPLRALRTAPKRIGGFAYLYQADGGIVRRPVA